MNSHLALVKVRQHHLKLVPKTSSADALHGDRAIPPSNNTHYAYTNLWRIAMELLDIPIICISAWCHSFNKSNTECGIIRPTNAIYMGSNSLLGSKALSKCEVNPTSCFQDIVFTSNILHRVEC